ncbi:MAG: hypothetical protein ACOYK6_00055 [Chthoniobacterales bacterium]
MNQNTTDINLIQLHQDWRKMRETAGEQLIQTRELLRKLDATPGTDASAKQEIESLAAQLTAACNQIDAQFMVVQKALEERDKAAYEQQIESLITKCQGWYAFFRIGTIDRKDFVNTWLQAMGAPQDKKDPAIAEHLGMIPKHNAACRAWEHALLFPRRVSSIMEVGSGFGLSAIHLSRMARLGTIEKQGLLLTLAKNLEKISPLYGRVPSIGSSHCLFQLNSASTIPIDAFDAIWFHRSIWNQWIAQDGPALISALSELARRAHFLLFTSNHEPLIREDLITPLYDIKRVGEYVEGTQKFYYFVAQRRSVSIAGKFFPCFDMRIHDPTWQGFETLHHHAAMLPWNNPSLTLNTKRYLLGKNQVARTFLKRIADQSPGNIHHRETEIWPSIQNLIPELPRIYGHSEDEIGYHLVLEMQGAPVRLPTLPLKKEEQYIILRSAIRVLDALRKNNLHLNFLRLGNFVLTGNFASFLAAEFVGYEELEEPLDALLWLLRDLNADILYWHDSPIEPFRAEIVGSLAEEHQPLANLALRSKNIDQFLRDPLVQHQFLSPL